MKYLALIFFIPLVALGQSRSIHQIDSFQSYYLNQNQSGLRVARAIKATKQKKNNLLSRYSYTAVKTDLVRMVDDMIFRRKVPTYASFIVYTEMIRKEFRECTAKRRYRNLRGNRPIDMLIWYNAFIYDNCL